MRIISKFYDYYDCIQKFGIDKSIIYNREEQEIKNDLPEVIKEFYRYRSGTYHINTYNSARCFAVILIDKCYFGLHLSDHIYDPNFKYVHHYFYTKESFYKYLNDNNIKIDNNVYRGYKDSLPIGCIDIGMDLAIKYKSPIFTYDFKEYGNEYTFKKDTFLKEYQFYKVMEPLMIYQKIQMFVSGVLSTPEKEPWPISDKLKAESHGFDKWSFRKQSKNS